MPLNGILRIAKNYPFRFGMGFSLMKTAGCDLMVQKVVEKRDEIDWKRTTAFGAFGLFYLGGVQYFLYVPVFTRLFPGAAAFSAKSLAQKAADGPGIRALFSQVFLDQFVHHPLTYFPVFYMIKDFVTSDAPSPGRAIASYRENMSEDLVALWKIWVPSTLVNFAIMPMWGRIPWVASTSLIWTCILSAMRGGTDKVPEVDVFPAVDAKTFELVTRGAFAPAPRLDPNRAHLLVNITGLDRDGLVKDISHALYKQGASITTSKMMSLGNEFSMTMHVECAPADVNAVQASLNDEKLRKEHGIDISCRKVLPVQKAKATAPVKPKFMAQISLTGTDRPGLLYRFAEAITKQGLGIEHLQTEQHRQRGGQPHLFTTHCHVVSQAQPDRSALKAAVRALEAELGVRIVYEVLDSRLHRTVTY